MPPAGPVQAQQRPWDYEDYKRAYTEGKPQRKVISKPLIMIIAAIAVVAVIAAAVLLINPLMGSSTLEFHNGDYLMYSVSGLGAYNQPVSGTMTMTFENVTKTNCTLEMTAVLNSQINKQSMNIDLTSGDWISNTGSSGPDSPEPMLIGKEALSTKYGTKTANHYSVPDDGMGFDYDYWEDASSGIPYKFSYVYAGGGTITMVLIDTNMM